MRIITQAYQVKWRGGFNGGLWVGCILIQVWPADGTIKGAGIRQLDVVKPHERTKYRQLQLDIAVFR